MASVKKPDFITRLYKSQFTFIITNMPITVNMRLWIRKELIVDASLNTTAKKCQNTTQYATLIGRKGGTHEEEPLESRDWRCETYRPRGGQEPVRPCARPARGNSSTARAWSGTPRTYRPTSRNLMSVGYHPPQRKARLPCATKTTARPTKTTRSSVPTAHSHPTITIRHFHSSPTLPVVEKFFLLQRGLKNKNSPFNMAVFLILLKQSHNLATAMKRSPVVAGQFNNGTI